MKFVIHFEESDPRFADTPYRLLEWPSMMCYEAFATKEDLLKGAREYHRKAQNRADEAQEEADGFQYLIDAVPSITD